MVFFLAGLKKGKIKTSWQKKKNLFLKPHLIKIHFFAEKQNLQHFILTLFFYEKLFDKKLSLK